MYLLRYAVVKQDCVKFSRQTERREQAGISVWHPISTHFALIAAGHLLPFIIGGLYTHGEGEREEERETKKSCHIILCLIFADTMKSFLQFLAHLLATIFKSSLKHQLAYEHTHSPSEQHMLTMISRDVCCADSSALASRNSSLSLYKPTGTQTNKKHLLRVTHSKHI